MVTAKAFTWKNSDCVENRVGRPPILEIWGTKPVTLWLTQQDQVSQGGVSVKWGNETGKPFFFFFTKANAVDAEGQSIRKSPWRNGERVTGNEKEEMRPRREQEMMH